MCVWVVCIPLNLHCKYTCRSLYTQACGILIFFSHIRAGNGAAAAAAELDVIVCMNPYGSTILLLWRQSSGNLCMLWFTLVTSSRWTNIALSTSYGRSVRACTVPNLIRWLHSSYIKTKKINRFERPKCERKKQKQFDHFWTFCVSREKHLEKSRANFSLWRRCALWTSDFGYRTKLYLGNESETIGNVRDMTNLWNQVQNIWKKSNGDRTHIDSFDTPPTNPESILINLIWVFHWILFIWIGRETEQLVDFSELMVHINVCIGEVRRQRMFCVLFLLFVQQFIVSSSSSWFAFIAFHAVNVNFYVIDRKAKLQRKLNL